MYTSFARLALWCSAVGPQTSGEENIFAGWFLYVCFMLWLAFTAVWLYRMNEALSRYNPIFMIPLLQVRITHATADPAVQSLILSVSRLTLR
jgi:hypothetical protein